MEIKRELPSRVVNPRIKSHEEGINPPSLKTKSKFNASRALLSSSEINRKQNDGLTLVFW